MISHLGPNGLSGTQPHLLRCNCALHACGATGSPYHPGVLRLAMHAMTAARITVFSLISGLHRLRGDQRFGRSVREAFAPVTAPPATEPPKAAVPSADPSAGDETAQVALPMAGSVRAASAPPSSDKEWCWPCSTPSGLGCDLNASRTRGCIDSCAHVRSPEVIDTSRIGDSSPWGPGGYSHSTAGTDVNRWCRFASE
jgi:hypothetical protein